MIEVRTGTLSAATPGRLTGYAAVFNSEAAIGDFSEVIRAGAFTRSLASSRSVSALYHHQGDALLGTTRSGTLKLVEDAKGLRFDLSLPDTTHGRDLSVLVERGDVSGCSFGFVVPSGGDRWEQRGGQMVRELLNVDLHEITLTADPAYPDTTVAKRTMPPAYQLFFVGGTNRLWLETL